MQLFDKETQQENIEGKFDGGMDSIFGSLLVFFDGWPIEFV